MRVDAVVLARGGSKGIPNKNIIDFCGKPLLAWTILQAQASGLISEIWVSSDSEEILGVAEQYGAKKIKRPYDISGDADSSESAWLHALEFLDNKGVELDYLLAPQVTSPLRETGDFTAAIKQIIDTKADSLLSVADIDDFFIWKRSGDKAESVNYDYKNRQLRQNIERKYLENGSFYIFTPQLLKETKNRLGGAIELFSMHRYKMFQIDEQEDIQLCSVMMKGYGLDII